MTLTNEETQEVILDQEEEAAEETSESTDTQEQETHEDENEVVVTIGDERPPEDETHAAPAWVKELRRTNRELLREKKELEQQLRAQTTETKPVTLGTKPTLESCDFDSDRFETELTAWHDRRRQADQEQQAQQDASKKQEEAWQGTLANYGKLKAEIKVKDFQEAEQEAQGVLSQTQQGIILQGAANPALVIYALGKNPKKAKELAAISDPVKYAFAIANLEAQLKVTTRKPATEPEKVVTGSGRVSGTVDSTLERLREDASKTGDFSKVLAYKNQKRAK